MEGTWINKHNRGPHLTSDNLRLHQDLQLPGISWNGKPPCQITDHPVVFVFLTDMDTWNIIYKCIYIYILYVCIIYDIYWNDVKALSPSGFNNLRRVYFQFHIIFKFFKTHRARWFLICRHLDNYKCLQSINIYICIRICNYWLYKILHTFIYA